MTDKNYGFILALSVHQWLQLPEIFSTFTEIFSGHSGMHRFR